VALSVFRIDRCVVSNRRFGRFAAASGHVTDAERAGWSLVFADLLPDDFEPTRGVAAAPWWRQVHRASWPGRVLRGGSHLCHPPYCWRYRVATRNAAAPDSSTGHIGFRCVRWQQGAPRRSRD